MTYETPSPITVNRRTSPITPRFIFGVLLIFLGVVFTLDQLGWIEDAEDIIDFWPVILIAAGLGKLLWPVALIAFGLCQLLDPELKPAPPNGLIAVLVGVVLLVGNQLLPDEHTVEIWLGFVQLRLSWPMVLVAAGGYIAWSEASAPAPALGGES